MRDIYAREKRLKYWIDRVYALEEPDRSDIIHYITSCKSKRGVH